jgi:hypothetical protein
MPFEIIYLKQIYDTLQDILLLLMPNSNFQNILVTLQHVPMLDDLKLYVVIFHVI